MRAIIVTAASLAALCAAAPAAAEDNWAGFSAGVHTGGESQSAGFAGFDEQINQFSGAFVPLRGIVIVPGTTRPFASQSHRRSQWQWGGQLGYTARINPNWVAGIEGDLDYGSSPISANMTADLPLTALQPISTVSVTRTLEARWLWSVRGRIGYTSDAWQVYATGGVAGGSLRASALDSFTSAGGSAAPCGSPPGCGTVVTNAFAESNGGAVTGHRTGWTVGGGAAYAINEHISLALEYRHTDLGSQVWALPNSVITTQVPVITAPVGATSGNGLSLAPNANVSPERISWRNDAVSVRLNYRFGN
jgi:opacity protein-like surface antigen